MNSPVSETFTRESTDPRALVVDGFGASLTVHRGNLTIKDGIGSHRRTRVLSRVERTVRRIIVLDARGYLSFDVIRWCTDIGIALVCTDDTGRPVLASTTPGEDARLRRVQAMAGADGPHASTGLRIVQSLLSAKLDGQAANLRSLGHRKAVNDIKSYAAEVRKATTVEACRAWEGQAAAVYWDSWAGIVGLNWKDLNRIPEHWHGYTGRSSLISYAARGATDPINAILNYLYRLAEIECVLACHATGLDPAFGVLHNDKPSRDSFALDLLETVRPAIERYVLDLVQFRTFTHAEFFQTRTGVCRLVAPLTHELAEQSPTWARLLAPVAEKYAHAFAGTAKGYVRIGKPSKDKTLMRGTGRRCTPSAHVVLNGDSRPQDIIPDHVWNTVKPLLPPERPTGRGRKPHDFRAVVAGLVLHFGHDVPWTHLPRTLGPTCYTMRDRYQQWKRSGVWDQIWPILQAALVPSSDEAVKS